MEVKVDEKKAFEEKAKIISTRTSFVVTIPKIILKREAKKLNIPLEKIPEVLEVKWLFNDFDGLVAILIPRNGDANPSSQLTKNQT